MARITGTPYAAPTAAVLAALLPRCALTSCSPSYEQPSPAAAPLTGVVWKADSVTVDGTRHPAPDKPSAWLRFDAEKGTVSGSDGCNASGGGAEIDTTTQTITPADDRRSTAIACYRAPALTEHFPPSAGPLRAETTTDTLTLTAPNGDTVLLHAEAEPPGPRPPPPLRDTPTP